MKRISWGPARYAPCLQIREENIENLIVRQIVTMIERQRHFIQVHVDVGAPVEQQAEFVRRQLLNNLVPRPDLPSVRSWICPNDGIDRQTCRLAHVIRPAGVRAMVHHFIFDDGSTAPHGCIKLFEFCLRAIRPIGEAATNLALIIPSQHLRLLGLPPAEQS